MRGAFAVVLALVAGCNSLLGIEDLTLVDAVPADARTLYEVREGVDGYTLTKDTYILDTEPTGNHGSDSDLLWTTTNNTHALIRFDDLFVSGGIPRGAIQSATLEIEVLEAGSPNGLIYEVKSTWDEDSGYNDLGMVVGVSAEDLRVQVGTVNASVVGKVMINVRSSVERWIADPMTNVGWIFVPVDTATVRIASKNHPDVMRRPKLTVVVAE